LSEKLELLVGTAAAVANAVYHAVRVRQLPIRLEKLLV